MYFNFMKVGLCGKIGFFFCYFDMCIGQWCLECFLSRLVDIVCVMLFEIIFFGYIYGIGDVFEINMYVNLFFIR